MPEEYPQRLSPGLRTNVPTYLYTQQKRNYSDLWLIQHDNGYVQNTRNLFCSRDGRQVLSVLMGVCLYCVR